jgi:hypothetical protein
VIGGNLFGDFSGHKSGRMVRQVIKGHKRFIEKVQEKGKMKNWVTRTIR